MAHTRVSIFLVLLLALSAFGQKPHDAALIPKFEQAEVLYWEADKLKRQEVEGSKRSAIAKYGAAAVLYSEIGSTQYEAVALAEIGVLYDNVGEPQKALEFYDRSLLIARQIRDKQLEADTLGSIAKIFSERGEQAKALELFKQALEIFDQLADRPGQALVTNNLGLVYSSLGEKHRALEYFDRALPLFKQLGNKRGEAVALSNLGEVYSALGEKQRGLELHLRSLSLQRQIGDKRGEGASLGNIGKLYNNLGEHRKALEYYDQSLTIRRQVGDKRGEAVTLANMGKSYDDLGEDHKALEYFERSLPLRRQVGDKQGEAVTLNNIGAVYSGLGEKQKAFEFYYRAFPMFVEMGDKTMEAIVLNNIALLHHDLGDIGKALEFYNRSLLIVRQVGDPAYEARTLSNIMAAWADQKVPDLAILYGKHTVNAYQRLRTNISGLDRETQRTYLKTFENVYRQLADLLIMQGRVAEAEHVLGMLKEEEYFSFMRRENSLTADLKARISLSPDEQKAFDDYEKIAIDVTRTAEVFAVLEKKSKALPLGSSLSAEDQKEYDRLKGAVDTAITVFNKFLDDLKIRFDQKGDKTKQVAAVESDSIGLLKELNEPRTVMISSIAGEDRLNLIVTTSDIQKAHIVNIKSADLNKLVLEFRAALRDPRTDPRPAGKRLYDTLLPLALKKDLDNIKADTIVWSLDGTLRYVPMAALWDGRQYLAETYRNAIITLASRNKLASPTAATSNWQAFGVGVSKKFETFAPLPAVPKELCSVISDPKKKEYCDRTGAGDGVINGMMLADDEFTLEAFQNNIGKTHVVHIASHFSLNPGNETDSYLLLGGGDQRRFSLDRLKKTRLDNVELLTLSACNTAMTSGQNSSGVEIEGFGALAQQQGAKSVMATLWAVADESTQLWMSEFYRLKKHDPKMSKAAAIQAAQVAMIEGRIKSRGTSSGCRSEDFVSGPKKDEFKCDPNAPYSHPYFWSPFVLIGNWR